jgi:predicted nucleotidyltransferase
MIIGYNKKRPEKKNYLDFEDKLIRGLSKIEDISLMFFGSYVRGDYTPGRSDIDAMLVFFGDAVIDKNKLFLCSKVLADSQEGNNIPFQVGVCDTVTLRDGRFNSYTAEFKDYFEEEGKIVVGKDPRPFIDYKSEKAGDLHSVSFNLRKTRAGLLFFEYNKKNDYERLIRDFTKSLDSTSRASKQLPHLKDGRLRKNRFSGIESIKNNFPDVDIETLNHIKWLYAEPSRIDKIYQNEKEMIKVWNSATATFEQMIKAYIQKCK